MQMRAGENGSGMVERLEAWWHDWRQKSRERAELQAAGPALLDCIARDAGAASTQEFLEVVNSGPRGSALMAEMSEALGVDLAAVRVRHPHVLRQMEISCSVCDAKTRCSCELEAGTAANHAGEFCNNAEVFQALRR